jgi:two-component system sensor histidine kinase EvgS
MSNTSHATRVLVVDDDAIVRMMLVEQLERAGAKPVAADPGEEALLLWEIGGLSIVVTDCSMTKMSGFELASEIRHREGSLGRPPCHVWGYTGNASEEAVKRGSESGMDGLVAKPASPGDLRRMLNGASTETTRVAGYESGAFSNCGLYRQWLADVRSDLALASAHYAAGRPRCSCLAAP